MSTGPFHYLDVLDVFFFWEYIFLRFMNFTQEGVFGILSFSEIFNSETIWSEIFNAITRIVKVEKYQCFEKC